MIVPPGRFRVSARSSAAGNQHDLSQDDEMKQTIDEIRRLRGCINDLISVQALPAMWTGQEPAQIVSTLLDVLIGMLRLEFAYARLKDPAGESPIEMLRLPQSRNLTASPQTIGHVLQPWLEDAPQKWPVLVRNPIGDGDVSIMPLRLGLRDKIGVIVAGSQRADFPVETERLLLRVAANQAAIGLQEARLLSEQKRVAEELDQRVAQRASQLLAANQELEKEIADRKQAVEKLRRSEAYLSEAQRLSHTGSFGWSVATGEIFWSEETFRIFQFDPTTKPTIELALQRIHPGDTGLVRHTIERASQNGEDFDIEHRLLMPDGSIKHLRVVGHAERDRAGELEFVGAVMDVTEQHEARVALEKALAEMKKSEAQLRAIIEDRKQAEEKLRRSEAYLAEAERLAHVGSSAFDVATGKIVHFSQEHFRLFGLDPEAGMPSFEVARDRIHPEDRDRILETFNKAVNERKDFEADHRTLHPDGTIKYVHVLAHPAFNASGELVEYVGTVMDVTERKRADEKLSEAQAELAHVSRVTTLGEMAASIAHEVDQPLSGVVINANACLRFLTGATQNLDEVRDGLQAIARDGRRASDVIGRIRALARGTTTEKEPLSINDVIREVVGLAEGEARRTRANIRTALTEDLPQVLGDRVQLQQVVLNLLLNGLDAMRTVADRPRELVISTQRDSNDRVRVAVQDSGSGINPQLANRMFDAFYTTKRGGMGMGLSISRSIVEQHGGRIWVAPNEGSGTTFYFTV